MAGDPRIGPVICGITRKGRGQFGIEFICIREPHDTEKQRSRRRSQLGYYPQSERHHFVRRYPYRSSE